jgi:hypothetical protein
MRLVLGLRNDVGEMAVLEETNVDRTTNFAEYRRICSREEVRKAACLLVHWKVGYGRGNVDGGFFLTNLMVESDFWTMERLPAKLFYLVEPLTKISDTMTLRRTKSPPFVGAPGLKY